MDCKAPRDRCFFNAIRRQIAWRNTRAFIKLSAETKGRSACTLPDLIRMGAVVHMTVNTAMQSPFCTSESCGAEITYYVPNNTDDN